VYGNDGSDEPLMLYARSITLPLYPLRPPLEITAPVPSHMAASLHRLGNEGAPKG
jgi:tRNA pseudouridine32 synthase/23S rRNA pseudouridine746 synthase